MSLLHLPDIVNSKSLQIWSNAAFDGAAGGSDVAAAKLPWSPLQPISTSQSESLDLYPSKENRSPSAVFDETPVSKKSSTAIKPLGGLIVVSGKASKVSFKEDSQIDDESIDGEIDVIEKEIKRLSSRLEALRIKKAERDSRDLDIRVSYANITRRSMISPYYNTMATRIAVVIRGRGKAKIVCPHVSREREERRGREEEEQGRQEGREEEEQQQQRVPHYQSVESGLSRGNVFVVLPGHPSVTMSSREGNLEVLCLRHHVVLPYFS